MPHTLRVLVGRYAVCRLAPDAEVPAWAWGPGFASVTRTAAELSVVCRQAAVPPEVEAERDWVVVHVEGPLDFGLTGVLASLVVPLAEAEIPVFAVSTFDTDYLLVKAVHHKRALAVLGLNHRVVQVEAQGGRGG